MATISYCCRSTLLLHRAPTATTTGSTISRHHRQHLRRWAAASNAQGHPLLPLIRRTGIASDVRFRRFGGGGGGGGVEARGANVGSTDTSRLPPVRTTMTVKTKTTTTTTATVNARNTLRWLSSGGGGHPPPDAAAAGGGDRADADDAPPPPPPSEPEPTRDERTRPEILYEGALASATLRLKRVSVTTCAVGLFLPVLALLYGGGDVPAAGQVAVGGTALLAATGSTAALNYCVSPYVHTIETVVVPSPPSSSEEGGSPPGNDDDESGTVSVDAKGPLLLKATTRNLLAWRVETVFDPETDVTHDTGARPFCNFVANGVPMYVHPELVEDDELRVQLVGKVKGKRVGAGGADGSTGKAKKAKKVEDDEFL